jgi:hypothetical protein
VDGDTHPLWHSDAIMGGGVHPIAYDLTAAMIIHCHCSSSIEDKTSNLLTSNHNRV